MFSPPKEVVMKEYISPLAQVIALDLGNTDGASIGSDMEVDAGDLLFA